jgi:phosphate-selective porin
VAIEQYPVESVRVVRGDNDLGLGSDTIGGARLGVQATYPRRRSPGNVLHVGLNVVKERSGRDSWCISTDGCLTIPAGNSMDTGSIDTSLLHPTRYSSDSSILEHPGGGRREGLVGAGRLGAFMVSRASVGETTVPRHVGHCRHVVSPTSK